MGGIRTFVRYVYRNFDPARYSLTLLAPKQPELETLLEDLSDFEITYLPVPFHPRHPGFPLMVARTILFGNYDLIHSQGFTAGIYASVPARLRGTRHLMTSHDVLLPEQFQGFQGRLKRGALALLLPRIDVIQSVSDDAARNLIEYVPNLDAYDGKCITVRNGIDVDRFRRAETRDLRKELGLPANMFLIGFLGRFMSQKGFRYLVDAVEILSRDTSLPTRPVIVATGEGGFVREDRAYVREKGLEEHVRFLPFSPNIAPVLRGLDVLAMPSLWEACGLLAMEAMVAGVPVIGTDCIGLREVLRDTPARMVAARNSLDLARAIEAEMKSPSKEAADGFSQEASRRFDVTQQSVRMEAVIRTLLGDPQESAS